MGQDKIAVGKCADQSRFQSRALFAGLEQSEGAPKLWFAVLAQAFRDYYGDIPSEGPSRYRKVQVNYCQRTARAWFLSDVATMGSFRWIAELFELDVQAVRKRLFSGARISLDEAAETSSRATMVASSADANTSDVVIEPMPEIVGTIAPTEFPLFDVMFAA